MRNSDRLERALELADLGEFYLWGDVDDDVCHVLGQALVRYAIGRSHLRACGHRKLHINTFGGSVQDGLALGRHMRYVTDELGVPIHTHIEGKANSMGLTIAQFGVRRSIDLTASVMTHDIEAFIGANNTNMNEARLGYQKELRLTVSRLFARRNTAGKNDPQWWVDNVFNGTETWLTAAKAKEWGLVDDIIGAYPTAPALANTP